MRILHVNGELGFSGGEVQVMLLLRGLREQGLESVLCAAEQSAIAHTARAEDFNVVPVTLRNDMDFPGLFKLLGVMKREKVDVVHLHTGRAIWLGSIAARLAGIPAIATKRMDRPIKQRLKSRLIWQKLLSASVGISQQVLDQMILGGVPKERCRLIYSTVDPASVASSVDRDALRVAEGVSADDLLLLSLGSLNHRKGFDVLMDALVILRDRGVQPKLWIAGEGPEGEKLKAYAGETGMGDQLKWLGQRSDAADLLKASDIVVMPSRAEGLGIACLEAMAAGCPVVASRVGGLQETIVDGESGLLVPVEDAEALAGVLQRLLEDGNLRRAMAEAGPIRVAEVFAPEKMVKDYISLYNEVLGVGS